jgi:RimJ/RimL family protein N-acetyltransferase
VARITGVRFSPSALLGENKVKIDLRKWNTNDFFRYLRLTLNKDYSKEFSSNFFGYLFCQGIKNLFIKNKDYKFAILVYGKFAGSVALYYKKEGYELGYFILKKFRGKGIANKSAKKIMDFGFRKLKLKKIMATTDMNNYISQKILKKLDFKRIREDKKEKEFIWEKTK